jgi:hypothetical protein
MPLVATEAVGRDGDREQRQAHAVDAVHAEELFRVGSRVLLVILAIGALMNFASSSPWERFLWGPVGVVLALLTWTIALSSVDTSS